MITRRKTLLFVFIPFIFVILTILSVLAQELEPILLREPELKRGKLLMQALNERKSTRSFSSKELPIDVLSNLLWTASGVNRPESGLRTVPSAVNWQEIDIYVAMEKGLYLYNPKQHMLEPIMAEDIREFTGMQDFTEKAPVDLIYVANFAKMDGDVESKTFYSAADTGFISQNAYLYCASEGLATVVLGWVDKPKLSEIMDLREDQKIILTQPIGYPE